MKGFAPIRKLTHACSFLYLVNVGAMVELSRALARFDGDGIEARSRTPRVIDNIDGDSTPNEILGPTHSTIWSLLIGLPGMIRAVHENHWECAEISRLGNLVLDVHRHRGHVTCRNGRSDRRKRGFDRPFVDEEAAELCEHQRPNHPGWCRWRGRLSDARCREGCRAKREER